MKAKLIRFMLGSTLKKLQIEKNPNESVRLKEEAQKLRDVLRNCGHQPESDEQFDSINPNNEKINYG